MSRLHVYFVFIFCVFFFKKASSQDIVINEYMSSNYNLLLDNDGEDSDWIEIYNNSDTIIDLSAYSLSDNSDDLNKWRFPDIVILQDSFLVVFASGKDTVYSNGEIHTNFSISSNGEPLFLFDGLDVVHEYEATLLEQNQSFGLLPDGEGEAVIFDVSSPGEPNEFIEIEKVFFSKRGGIYDSCFFVSLSNVKSENTIFYTIDGGTPNSNSIQYLDSIYLDEEVCSPTDIYKIQISPEDLQYIPDFEFPKAVVIRAASFDILGNIKSNVVTQTYFIQEMDIMHNNLPIVSITADYDALFDDTIGVFVPGIHSIPDSLEWTGNYYQHGILWERNSNIEMYFPSESKSLNTCVGLRTHGGNARRFPQKGFKVYARGEYGAKRMNVPIFDNSDISQYKTIAFKPLKSSWSQAGYEDYLSSLLAEDLMCDNVDSRPSIVYINGEYWGIYYVQERIDEHYLESHYNVDEENVNIIENWWGSVAAGSNEDFMELYQFVADNDLSSNENYYWVYNRIDIRNFIDYQIFEMYAANFDWSANNMKCWKQNDSGKWKWVFFDGDACFSNSKFDSFDHATNVSDDYWPTNEGATMFFRKLIENGNFKFQFESRLSELINNEFQYFKISQDLEGIYSALDENIDLQIDRFQYPSSTDAWLESAKNIEMFLMERPCEFSDLANAYYGFNVYSGDCKVKDENIELLEVYPNPNNGSFKLEIIAKISNSSELNIYNSMGMQVYSQNVFLKSGLNSIDFSQEYLSNGIYILSINSNGKYFSQKIVVQ